MTKTRLALSFFLALLPGSAQSNAVESKVFESRCSGCHGGDASGGDRAPSLLAFVRYHTDAELSDVIQTGRTEKGMPAFALADGERNALMAHLRALAGSNPAMAIGGLTGQNRKLPSTRAVRSSREALTLSDGRSAPRYDSESGRLFRRVFRQRTEHFTVSRRVKQREKSLTRKATGALSRRPDGKPMQLARTINGQHHGWPPVDVSDTHFTPPRTPLS